MILANPPCYIYVNFSSNFSSILVSKNIQNRIPNPSRTSSHSSLIPKPIFGRFGIQFLSILGSILDQFGFKIRSKSNLKSSLAFFLLLNRLPNAFQSVSGPFWEHLGTILHPKPTKNLFKIVPKSIQNKRLHSTSFLYQFLATLLFNQQAPKPSKSLKNSF